MLTMIADEKIPYLDLLFGQHGKLIKKPGQNIHQQDLINAQALITRTITPIDKTLLKNTTVEFVGSATIGYDHINQTDLETLGIDYHYASGANSAHAVSEYVLTCMAYCRQQGLLSRKKKQAAIIGAGNIGSYLTTQLRSLGFTVQEYDPPKAEHDPFFHSASIHDVQQADIISLHTPLTHTGKYPTYHLIDAPFLEKMKSGCVLINTARGAVIDNQALLKNNHYPICLDVWEKEPHITLELLKKSCIATPHIAGYSQRAKWQNVLEIYCQFLKHFNLNDKNKASNNTAPISNTQTFIDIKNHPTWEDILTLIYPIQQETMAMQSQLLHQKNPAQVFESLRANYALRKEWADITLTPTPKEPLYHSLYQLGFQYK